MPQQGLHFKVLNIISQSPRTGSVPFHSCEGPRGVKFIEAGSRTVTVRGWKEGMENWSLMSRVSILQDGKVLEMDSSGSCTAT